MSQRYPDGQERPVGYASRTLSKAEQNYSQIEKEGLACVFGVKRFHCYLYGRSFILSSDHKPLASLFAKDKIVPVQQASARIQRWALTLGMYELIHKSGSSHGNADALSCLPLPSAPSVTPQPAETVLLFEELQNGPVTADQIKMWTRRDPVLSRVQQFVLKGWPTGAIEKDLKPTGTSASSYHHMIDVFCGEIELWSQQQVKQVCWRSYMLHILELHR